MTTALNWLAFERVPAPHWASQMSCALAMYDADTCFSLSSMRAVCTTSALLTAFSANWLADNSETLEPIGCAIELVRALAKD